MPASPTDPYREILGRAQSELDRAEQIRLAEVLATGGAERPTVALKLADLEGLGREVWEGVDVGEYLARERDSWE